MHPHSQARQQARQLADSGDLAGARALLERVVDLDRPGLAAGDPELLATMRQLAGLHAQDADLAGARRLLEEAYAAGQRIGPADPLMVLLAYDLAVVAEELVNRHEARKNFALVAEYGPAALGEGHPAVSHARDYMDEGAPPAAEPTSSPMAPPPVSGSPTVPLPVSGSPMVPLPVSGSPMVPLPVSGSPAAPLPVFVPPVSDALVPGSPVSGVVVSAPPFGGAPGGGTRSARTPWIIAAAAVVFAVAMFVVVLVRPSAQPASGTPVADATSATTEPTTDPTTRSPTTTRPTTSAPATTEPTEAAPTTTAPRTAAVSRIVTPKNGSGVARRFTVTFTVSAADVAAVDTRLALTVCVKQWCFLDGPVVIRDGAAEAYTVTLGTGEGEGVGEKWTVRIDRLSQSTYDYLQGQKQAAVENGTWGKNVTTPTDRLNRTPVSSVVVTKTS